MTLGGKEGGSGGITIQWPLVAVTATVIISLVTGAIQLGTVQTHVVINTGRLDQLEAREREGMRTDSDVRDRTSRLDSAFNSFQKRIDNLDARIQRSLDDQVTRIDRLNERLNAAEQALVQHRSKSSYDSNATPYDSLPNNSKQRSPP